MRISDWSSDVCSSDLVTRLVVLDDELVLGAASGVLAGRDDERAVLGKPPFIVAHRILDQRRRAPVFGQLSLRPDGVAADHNLGPLIRLSFSTADLSITMQCCSTYTARRKSPGYIPCTHLLLPRPRYY